MTPAQERRELNGKIGDLTAKLAFYSIELIQKTQEIKHLKKKLRAAKKEIKRGQKWKPKKRKT